jgi:hypothetical protein
MRERIFLFSPPTGLDAYSQNALELPCRVTPALPTGFGPETRPACAGQPPRTYLRPGLAIQKWFRNINRMSIAYDVRPRLRPD